MNFQFLCSYCPMANLIIYHLNVSDFAVITTLKSHKARSETVYKIVYGLKLLYESTICFKRNICKRCLLAQNEKFLFAKKCVPKFKIWRDFSNKSKQEQLKVTEREKLRRSRV